MSNEDIDLKLLDEELMQIYDSSRNPNKAIEKKILEVIENVGN